MVGKPAFELLFGSSAGECLMLLVGLLESLRVHLESTFLRHLHGQFQRETVGLVEIEGGASADDLALHLRRNAVNQFVELLRAVFQRLRELLLLAVELLPNHRRVRRQFWVELAVFRDDNIRDF